VADAGPMTAGSFKPTSVNSTAVAFPAPAPAGPYLHPAPSGSATLSNAFFASNPNGYWSLYVRDDVSSASPTVISNGWCLTIETPPAISLNVALAGTDVLLSWSNSFTGYTLQSTPQLLSPSSSNVWTSIPGPYFSSGGNFVVTNSAISNRFYRLFY
jgi:hypothetical protein